ncbi:MAG: hypothetical protein U0271_18230 [Polyangiaceae bacterium]
MRALSRVRILDGDMSLLRAIVPPLAASIDTLVGRALTGRSAKSRARSRSESLGHAERVAALDRIVEAYRHAEPLEDTARFFGEIQAPDVREEPRGERHAARVSDVRWRSRVETFARDERLAERFAAERANHEAIARLFRGPGSARPAAILIHGYRAGNLAVEERFWPVRWLLRGGLDVALFVMPFHGPRATKGSPPRFPASDPRFTVEGFRQAIFDLGALAALLRARGAPAVGVMGMSMGGYTTALAATVLDDLAFAVPFIPLASFADVAREAGRLVGEPHEREVQHRAIERAHRPVSPFARPSKVDRDAVLVVGGEGDRVTPIAHAQALARHFESELVTFPGGHLLQVGRRDGFRAIGRMLRRRGLMR